MRSLACVAVLLAVLPSPARGQNSVLGVRGIGFPARSLSAASRGMGGGDAIVDRLSTLNPAAVGLLPQATAMLTMTSGWRAYEVGAVDVSGLKETRFPLVAAGGRLGSRVGFGVAIGTLAERTWDVTATDTLMLRGVPVITQDRLRSDGSIADIAGSLAWRPSRTLSVGLGVHALTGSERLIAQRAFSDSTFRPYEQRAQTAHRGWGVSAGAVYVPTPSIEMGISVRSDGALASDVDSVAALDVPLPSTVAGGVVASVLPGLQVAATVIWRSWSDADGAFGPSTSAFNTWDVGAGVTLGGDVGPPIPLRLGLHYGQLPFAPAGNGQAREVSFVAGTGFRFARGRGLLDFALERTARDGGGIAERAWQFTVGMTVRP